MTLKRRWKLVKYLIILSLIVLLYYVHERGRVEHTTTLEEEVRIEEEPTPEGAGEEEAPAEDGATVIESKIGPGESFYTILTDQGISPEEVYRLTRAVSDTYDLARVRAGNWFKAVISREQSILFLQYQIDNENALMVEGDGAGYQARLIPLDFERVVEKVSGAISTSLFDAVVEEGESPELALELARLYGWDIDFHTDLRRGDSFNVLVEKRFLKGEFHSYGRILAARFVNADREHYAFYFDDGKGRAEHYDADGKCLRRQFLKSPIKFGRVSSVFTKRRFHPIRKAYMPHLGVDYAAPVGTPVVATADGKVVDAAYKAGNGKYIKISHGNSYATYYLHLSRFAKGIKAGARVKQGQVIGYVGSTGMSTGPHLDYRLKRDGGFVDPLKFHSQPAEPVGKQDMERFKEMKERLLEAMNGEDTVLTDLLLEDAKTVN